MKKILTIQDISCVGQCSLTVAMPIISAMGIETCILPSAILSTHTYNFKNYTFRDLTEDLPDIKNHWKSENISFDGIYTGYIGSTKQIAGQILIAGMTIGMMFIRRTFRQFKTQICDNGTGGIGQIVECIRHDGNRTCQHAGDQFSGAQKQVADNTHRSRQFSDGCTGAGILRIRAR